MSRFDSIDPKALKGMSQVAAEALAPSYQFLTWKYPDYETGGVVVTNSKWLALTDEAAIGWVCRNKERRLIGEHTVPWIEGVRPPRPNSLRDQNEWETIEKGKDGPWKKDPWEYRTKLPLLNIESGKVVVFAGENRTTYPVVGRILTDFTKTLRRPLIILTTAPQEDKPDAVEPFFEIVEHTEHDEEIMGTSLARHIELPTTIKRAAPARVAETLPAQKNDMDDEIPF